MACSTLDVFSDFSQIYMLISITLSDYNIL